MTLTTGIKVSKIHSLTIDAINWTLQNIALPKQRYELQYIFQVHTLYLTAFKYPFCFNLGQFF